MYDDDDDGNINTILVYSGISIGILWFFSSVIHAADANRYERSTKSKYDYVDKRKSKKLQNMKTYGYSLLWPFSSMYRNWEFKKIE